MSSPYVYHNYQADGDHMSASKSNLKGEDAVLQVVRQAYENWQSHIIEKGIKKRHLEAYHYSRYQIPRYVAFGEEGLNDGEDNNGSYINDDEDMSELDASELCDKQCRPSNIFTLDLIRQKLNIAMSLTMDAMKHRGSNYALIEPTPVVDASDETLERVARQTQDQLVRDVLLQSMQVAQQTGQDPEVLMTQTITNILSREEGLEYYENLADTQFRLMNSRLTSEARVKANAAQKAVNDDVTESNFDEEELTQIQQSLYYDYSAIRSGSRIVKKDTDIDQDSGYLQQVEKEVWDYQAIHPLNYIFAPNRTFVDHGDYEGDIIRLSTMELEHLKSLNGSREKNINHVMDQPWAYRTIQSFSSHHVEEDYDDAWSELDRIEIIRLNIRLSGDLCRKLFPDKAKKIKGNYGREVEIWCTHDKILRAVFEPYYLDYRPYQINAFQIQDPQDIASARGLYSLLSSLQEMVFNSLVQWKHSLKYIQKAIMEVNQDKLRDKDPDLLDHCLKSDLAVIPTKGGGITGQYGGNDRAIYINQLPDKTNTFISSLQNASILMDSVSFPSFVSGSPDLPSSVRSTGSLTLLQANANKNIQKFFLQQEKMIHIPTFQYIWEYLCLHEKDRSITVDSNIQASSYSGFLLNDQRKNELQAGFQNLSVLMDRKLQYEQIGANTDWIDSFILELAEQSGMDISKLPISNVRGDFIGSPTQDIVNQPIENLSPVNNVPQDINQIL